MESSSDEEPDARPKKQTGQDGIDFGKMNKEIAKLQKKNEDDESLEAGGFPNMDAIMQSIAKSKGGVPDNPKPGSNASAMDNIGRQNFKKQPLPGQDKMSVSQLEEALVRARKTLTQDVPVMLSLLDDLTQKTKGA